MLIQLGTMTCNKYHISFNYTISPIGVNFKFDFVFLLLSSSCTFYLIIIIFIISILTNNKRRNEERQLLFLQLYTAALNIIMSTKQHLQGRENQAQEAEQLKHHTAQLNSIHRRQRADKTAEAELHTVGEMFNWKV